MKLWPDDIRNPIHHGHYGWHWVRTAEEAIAWLKAEDIEIEEASLDHDLTPEQMEGGIYGECRDDGQKSGYDVVRWLERNPERWPSGGVKVHSANPAGAARMQQVIERHYSPEQPVEPEGKRNG